MRSRQVTGLFALMIVVLQGGRVAPARQAPVPGGEQSTARPPQKRALVAGENPIMRLLDKPGGTALTEINFWRVHWSPVGSGNVCYVTTRDSEGRIKLRIALYDNPKLLEYATAELMPNLIPKFADPPFAPIEATFRTEGDGIRGRREICSSASYAVEAAWSDLGESRFIEEQQPSGLDLSFLFIPANKGAVFINGTAAKGSVFPAPRLGAAFLSFNETWRK
jgi:hypothetical protein